MATQLQHKHYFYLMRFNQIRKSNKATYCNMPELQHLQQLQRATSYWKSLKEGEDIKNVAYCESSHCCLVDANIPTKPASSATSERNFNLINTITAEEIGLKENSNKLFLVDNTLFESMVVPLSVFHEVRAGLLRMWEAGTHCNWHL